MSNAFPDWISTAPSIRQCLLLALGSEKPALAVRAMQFEDDSALAKALHSIKLCFSESPILDLSFAFMGGEVKWRLTREGADAAAEAWLNTYDELRLDRAFPAPDLRLTVEAMFELREALDIAPVQIGEISRNDLEWLDWPLSRFPISAQTLNRLRKADLFTLRQIEVMTPSRICGLTGLSDRMLDKMDEAVWNYVRAVHDDLEGRAWDVLNDYLQRRVSDRIQLCRATDWDLHELLELARGSAPDTTDTFLHGWREFVRLLQEGENTEFSVAERLCNFLLGTPAPIVLIDTWGDYSKRYNMRFSQDDKSLDKLLHQDFEDYYHRRSHVSDLTGLDLHYDATLYFGISEDLHSMTLSALEGAGITSMQRLARCPQVLLNTIVDVYKVGPWAVLTQASIFFELGYDGKDLGRFLHYFEGPEELLPLSV